MEDGGAKREHSLFDRCQNHLSVICEMEERFSLFRRHSSFWKKPSVDSDMKVLPVATSKYEAGSVWSDAACMEDA